MTYNYDVNFRGGYLIEKPSPRVWKNIKAMLPEHGKNVFDRLNEAGDTFFAIRPQEDKHILKQLLLRLNKNVKFKFYPDIDTKLGLDPLHPECARKVIAEQTRVIEDRGEIEKFADSITTAAKVPLQYKWKPDDHIEQTLKAFNLKAEDCLIEKKMGMVIIKDKNSKKIILKASPNSHYGFNYVYEMPKVAGDDEAKKWVVDYKGEKEPFPKMQYREFVKNFERCVRVGEGRKMPQK